MVIKLFQLLFVPKRARKSLNGGAGAPAKGLAKGAASPKASSGDAPSKSDAGREDLLKDAMAVYRKQREDVYDSLDDETRRQIEEDAEKAFGKVLRAKD